MKPNKLPTNILEAIRYFSNPDVCHNFMVAMRWPDGVKCPRCGSADVAFVKTKEENPRRLWNCHGCKKQFSAKVGTIFEDSPLGFDKWMPALWWAVNSKNGISSCELARHLAVTQKSAWFMLHRIRTILHNGSMEKLSGETEVDETFVGGLAKNMHESRKRHIGTGGVGKSVVMGFLERKGRVIAEPIPNVRKKTLHAEVRKHVEVGSPVFTDSASGYAGLNSHYAHEQIDHAVCYAKDNIHTNGMENFWNLLKRSVKGTYT